MSTQNPTSYPPQQPKKPLSWRLKMALKDGVSNIWDWWSDLPLMRQLFLGIAVLMPAITMPLSQLFWEVSNPVVDIIHLLAAVSQLIVVFMVYRWICGMLFSDAPTRRKLYCLIIVFLWLLYAYCHFFVDDANIQNRMLILAGIGSIWMCVPMFLSFWTFVYYHDER